MSTPGASLKSSSWGKAFIGLVALVIFIGFAFFVYTMVQPGVTSFQACEGGTTSTYIGDFVIGDACYNAFQLVFGTEIDVTWVTTSSILQFMIFPFIAIVMVMYGIFTEIHIFRQRSFNIVLSVIVTLVVASQGILVRMMRAFILWGGSMGIIFFGILFVVGVILWFVGRASSDWGVRAGKLSNLGQRNQKIQQVKGNLATARSLANGLVPGTDGGKIAKAQKMINDAETLLLQGGTDESKLDDALHKSQEAMDVFN